MSILGVVPGLRLAAPRDTETLRTSLREAVAINDGPTVARFPTGSVPAALPALRHVGGIDVLTEAPNRRDILLITVGPFAHVGVQVAAQLAQRGLGVPAQWIDHGTRAEIGLTQWADRIEDLRGAVNA
jgi:1-deoxy-D-xylulose-5-phosphate synthase